MEPNKKYNVHSIILIGLLGLVFYLFTIMAILKFLGHPVEQGALMKEVIIYILGIISGVIVSPEKS